MDTLVYLEVEIAKLREQLNFEILHENENHVPSKNMLKISRKLDELILRYQTFLEKKEK